MQSVDGDIFDGANLAPGCPLHGGDAGTDGLAILVDRTGAAERHAAAELGSVSARTSRRYQSSGISGSPSNERWTALTLSWIMVDLRRNASIYSGGILAQSAEAVRAPLPGRARTTDPETTRNCYPSQRDELQRSGRSDTNHVIVIRADAFSCHWTNQKAGCELFGDQHGDGRGDVGGGAVAELSGDSGIQ